MCRRLLQGSKITHYVVLGVQIVLISLHKKKLRLYPHNVVIFNRVCRARPLPEAVTRLLEENSSLIQALVDLENKKKVRTKEVGFVTGCSVCVMPDGELSH